jgi:ribose transport system substrate-binding protein
MECRTESRAENRRRGGGIVAALAAIALILTGCATPTTDAASSDSSGPDAAWLTEAKEKFAAAQSMPEEIYAAQFGEFTPKEDGFFYYISCGATGDGCVNFGKALKEATAALGYKFEECPGVNPDALSQCFTQAVNAKPDAVFTTGVSVETNGDDYAKLEKAGIPLVGAFTGNPDDTPGVAVEIGGNATQYAAGQAMADGIIASTDGKANVLFFTTDAFTTLKEVTRGIQDGLKKCDTCSIKVENFSVATMMQTLPSQVLTALQQNPEVNVLSGSFDTIVQLEADAVRQSGKTGIVLGGLNGFAPNLELIRNGEQDWSYMQGRLEWGWQAADAGARIVAGLPVQKDQDLTWVYYTKENGEENFGKEYQGPKDFKEQFLKLWGKS